MSIPNACRIAIAASALALAASAADASIVIGGTRLAYAEKDREVTIKLTNEGAEPALVQSWIDDGDAATLPEDTRVPFTLTPPLFRLEPRKSQTLRIVHTKEDMPKDRESLFWLNVLEVPPTASASEATNTLQLAFRSRIKLFYRPTGLAGTPDDAPAKVTWKFARKADGTVALAATNPTAYHVTFARVAATSGGASYANENGAMVAPGETAMLDIGDAKALQAEKPDKVEYTFINDYGAGKTGATQAVTAK